MFNVFYVICLQSYKVYYTTNPTQPEQSWDSQMVDNSELTTISELTPHAIYTVRIQAFTSMGAGPMSTPVQVKTQQGLQINDDLFVHARNSKILILLQVFHRSLVALEQLILVKRELLCNGSNQHILVKILSIMNYTGMIHMLMINIISE